MPIYEYLCKVCGKECELLISREESPCCPNCGSKNLQRLLSLFGVRTSSPTSSSSCSSCSRSTCAGCK